MIRAAFGSSHCGMPLRYLENPAYERGPRLSLWTGREFFRRDDVLLADADVLFAPALLQRVVGAPASNVFLASPSFLDTGEEVVLYSRVPTPGEASSFPPESRRVVAILRGVAGPPPVSFETRAEWVGFVKVGRAAGPELVDVLDRMVREGRVDGDYETALDLVLPRHLFASCSTDDLPWIEIDFPQDLQAAESEVLPRILRLGSSQGVA